MVQLIFGGLNINIKKCTTFTYMYLEIAIVGKNDKICGIVGITRLNETNSNLIWSSVFFRIYGITELFVFGLKRILKVSIRLSLERGTYMHRNETPLI